MSAWGAIPATSQAERLASHAGNNGCAKTVNPPRKLLRCLAFTARQFTEASMDRVEQETAVIIRRAELADARKVAELHVATWKEAIAVLFRMNTSNHCLLNSVRQHGANR